MSNPKQMCTMRAGDLFIGVDVMRIQEVIGYQSSTPIPLAPPAVRGLINLRGQIITAVDLRRRFDLADRDPGVEPMNVVVVCPSGAVSLLVDSIGDVVEVLEATSEAVPSTVSDKVRALVVGVYKFDGELMLELDVDAAVTLDAHLVSA